MSTTWFAKIDCNFHSNRKAMRAGRIGREVYIFVLCINATRGSLGEFPAEDLDYWYVAKQLEMTEEEARQGVDACTRERLIEIEDGLVRIVGWSNEYSKYPMGAAEKQKRYRERSKNRHLISNHADTTLPPLPVESNALPQPVTPLRNEVTVTQVGREVGREVLRESVTALPSVGNESNAFVYDHENAGHRGTLATETWIRLSKARIGLAAEIGHPAPLALPPITPGTHPASFDELRKRIREEGANAPAVIDGIFAVLVAEARKARSLEWLAERMFTEGCWRTARAKVTAPRAATIEQVAPRKRDFVEGVWVTVDEASP